MPVDAISLASRTFCPHDVVHGDHCLLGLAARSRQVAFETSVEIESHCAVTQDLLWWTRTAPVGTAQRSG